MGGIAPPRATADESLLARQPARFDVADVIPALWEVDRTSSADVRQSTGGEHEIVASGLLARRPALLDSIGQPLEHRDEDVAGVFAEPDATAQYAEVGLSGGGYGCGPRWYLSGILGLSSMRVASGGQLSIIDSGIPVAANTGTGGRTEITAGGALGISFDRPAGFLRAEFEGRARGNFTSETDIEQLTALTVPTTYDLRVADGWSTMVNLWRDLFITNRLLIYGGGGIGAGGYRIFVQSDVTPGGAQAECGNSITKFAWQVGGGVVYRLTERIDLDLGYRYFQLGTGSTHVPLTTTPAAAGTYRSSLSSNETLLTLRIYDPFARWWR